MNLSPPIMMELLKECPNYFIVSVLPVLNVTYFIVIIIIIIVIILSFVVGWGTGCRSIITRKLNLKQ